MRTSAHCAGLRPDNYLSLLQSDSSGTVYVSNKVNYCHKCKKKVLYDQNNTMLTRIVVRYGSRSLRTCRCDCMEFHGRV